MKLVKERAFNFTFLELIDNLFINNIEFVEIMHVSSYSKGLSIEKRIFHL